MKKEIILSSSNKHKILEVASILDTYTILSLKDVGIDIDVEETAETFAENALIKALAVWEITKMPVIADDSGLCVDFLDGQPGIYSARFSGKGDAANNHLLLEKLKDVPLEKRTARFVSAAAIVFEDGSEAVTIGETPGKIGFDYKGDGGFGYDPLFTPEGFSKTYAQMTPEEKNLVSHRRISFEALKEEIQKRYDN